MYAWKVTTPEGVKLLDCGSCVATILQHNEVAKAEQVEVDEAANIERCSE